MKEEKTGVTPDALLKRPSYDQEITWYLNAFFMLTGSRNNGMSIGRIPISEILAYASAFELISSLEEFVTVITAMDVEYVRVSAPKQSPAKPKK